MERPAVATFARAASTGLIALLGVGAALLVFAVRGSPLYQSSDLWKVYNCLFGAPFALWLWDRFTTSQAKRWQGLALDCVMLSLVAARSRGIVPVFSGHAVFFAYAMATANRKQTWCCAGLSLLAASAIKLWAWHDWMSLSAGMLMGIAAGHLYRRITVVRTESISAC
jgi:hypothetical protein